VDALTRRLARRNQHRTNVSLTTCSNVLYYLVCLLIPATDAIRLVGSEVNYTGRLEIEYNGYWGTVCDDDFGMKDAKVACYMLGFGCVHLNVNYLSSILLNILILSTEVRPFTINVGKTYQHGL